MFERPDKFAPRTYVVKCKDCKARSGNMCLMALMEAKLGHPPKVEERCIKVDKIVPNCPNGYLNKN